MNLKKSLRYWTKSGNKSPGHPVRLNLCLTVVVIDDKGTGIVYVPACNLPLNNLAAGWRMKAFARDGYANSYAEQ